MRTFYVSGTMLVFCLAAAYGQATDSLTGLAVIPAAEVVVVGTSYGFRPVQVPGGVVCKSKMKGDFYALANMNVKDKNIKVSAVVAWYAAHLSGFKKVQGFASGSGKAGGRSQTAFYNSDGTIVIVITGSLGRQEEDTSTYGINYERYDPGISEKTIASLTQQKILCP